ncbi:MAG: spondin domain-containing protein, partial [Planctomycetota bacterium]
GPLRGQISNAIDDGTAINFILGGRLDSPGAHPDLEFDATRAHDRLTLVTMIAPSPDWFLGIHGLPLRDNNGDWITSMTVGLDAYDAGTDSGPGFTSANADLTPHAPITNIQNDAPFAGLPQLASFTITLIDVMPCPADINRDGLADGSDFFAWVAAFGNGDPIADTNEDGTVSGSDFFSWVAAFGIGCE